MNDAHYVPGVPESFLAPGMSPVLSGPVLAYDRAWLDRTPDPQVRPGTTFRDLLRLDEGLGIYDLLDHHIVTDLLGYIDADNDDGGHDGMAVTGWQPAPGVTVSFHATYGRRDNHSDGADGLMFHAVIPDGPILADRVGATAVHRAGARGEAALELLLTSVAHAMNATARVHREFA
ncbi:hypothetical protein [Nocardia sp. XZ_19_369]|uniref:hypothetical protein n=1 Tax=Nocardia sp. XZ_19_369 TaxID=2769487 RepID=UPI0018903809|nr:hypothetical protein [Nocardia sp. XZ_19_369]